MDWNKMTLYKTLLSNFALENAISKRQESFWNKLMMLIHQAAT